MSELTSKQVSFVEYMTRSEEHARRGFELLKERSDAPQFFDTLAEFGLLDPKHNPAPVPVEDGKYVRVPYWAALDFLHSCATAAAERNDDGLARKILGVIRAVTVATKRKTGRFDNYHTAWKFAEFLGILPVTLITDPVISLIPAWLETKYDHGMVAHALSTGLLPRLTESSDPKHWSLGCKIVGYCTEIKWVTDSGEAKPIPRVDEHWFNELVTTVSGPLGGKAGLEITSILQRRVQQVFSKGTRSRASWLFRPAVEEHQQNHSWDTVDNAFVVSLRDSALAWIDAQPSPASDAIRAMLSSKVEMIRRIGIFLLNQRWPVLNSAYADAAPQLFQIGHVHELYWLLKERFSQFSEQQKRVTLRSIKSISAPTSQSKRTVPAQKLIWLSAIANQGHAAADHLFKSVSDDPRAGVLSKTPDFLTYMESRFGPGPSPYSVVELLDFLERGVLVSKLNAFRTQDAWRGPTRGALCDALTQAVAADPLAFGKFLNLFTRADRPYQYAVINGFQQVWDLPEDRRFQSWGIVWPLLVSFFEALLFGGEFWTEPVEPEREVLEANRDWIPPAISRLLAAATRSDDRTIDDALLPKTWNILKTLVDRSPGAETLPEDPMSAALNTSKGRALDALISHSLRLCRLNDRTHGAHELAWDLILPVFEQELQKSRNANFEFSTTIAAHLPQLEYMNRSWMVERFSHLFPLEFEQSLRAALNGLSYSQPSKAQYVLLKEHRVIEKALELIQPDDKDRSRLLERVALAYIWGLEELANPPLARMYLERWLSDLRAISRFFWTLRNQNLTMDHKARILLFWRATVDWCTTDDDESKKLLSMQSELVCYLHEVNEADATRLRKIAPFVHIGFRQDDFLEQLDRLAPSNAEVVADALMASVSSSQPTFDYEGKLQKILTKLWTLGQRHQVIATANQLTHLPTVRELIPIITGRAPD